MNRGSWLRIAAILGPCLLMLLFAWTPGISFSEDLGRHLLLGRIIIERRSIPAINLLTYTWPDFPVLNHHWLAQVALYAAHRLVGLNGLIVVKTILMAAALALAVLAGPRDRDSRVLWLAGVGAAVMMGYRAHIRPELATYFFAALFLFVFERIRRGRAAAWLALPPLMWVWANTHIYFIFGLGMAAAFGLERILAAFRRGVGMRAVWAHCAGAALLAAVCAAGPGGVERLLYPLRIFDNYGVAIVENASPAGYLRSVFNPMLLALPFMSALAVAACVRMAWNAFGAGRAGPGAVCGELAGRVVAACGCRDGFRLADLIITVAALAAAWFMARSAPLLGLAALPAVGSAWRTGDGGGRSRGFGGPAAAVAAVLLNIWLAVAVLDGAYFRVFPSPISPQPMGFDDESRFLRLRDLARQGLKGPVFTDYNIGSLVEYNLYPQLAYVDNRPEAFPASFWRMEYEPALRLDREWESVRAMRGFNSVIVSLVGVGAPFIGEMARRPEWVLAHLDEICAVFVLDHERNAAFISGHAKGEENVAAWIRETSEDLSRLRGQPFHRRQAGADRLLFRLYGLFCIGERERIWPLVKQLHLLYPDFQQARELLYASAPDSEMDLILGAMRRAARLPVSAKESGDYIRLLESLGRSAEAERERRRARFFFPFNPAFRG